MSNCKNNRCSDKIIIKRLVCARICDTKYTNPIAKFSKNITDSVSCNYPIPIVEYQNEVLFSDSVFSDNSTNVNRQFRWNFYFQGQLIGTSGFGFGGTPIPSYNGTATFDRIETGTSDNDLQEYIETIAGYSFLDNDEVYITLDIIDAIGIQSSLTSNFYTLITIDFSGIWAQQQLNSYLLLNEHVDAFGVDIPNRTLSTTDKDYIYDSLKNELYNEFGSASATYGKRSVANWFYFMKSQATRTASTAALATVTPLMYLMNTTSYTADRIPAHVEPSNYNFLIISSAAIGSEFSEWNAGLQFRTAGAFSYDNCILPIFQLRFLTSVTATFNDRIFTGKIPNMLPSYASLGFMNLQANTPANTCDEIDMDFVARCHNGLSLRRHAFGQVQLETIIDTILANAPSLVPNSILNLSANPDSGIVAGTKALEIAILSSPPYNWTVSI